MKTKLHDRINLLDRVKLDSVWLKKLHIDLTLDMQLKNMQMDTLGPSLQYLRHPSTVLATHHLTGITGCLWLRWSDGCQAERQPGICLYWIVNCWASVLQKQQICWHRVQCFSERVYFSSSIDRMLLNCPNFCNKGLIKGIMSCISVDKYATMKFDRVLAISLQHMFYGCNQNMCIEAI